jgi:co-chaperonin GroES (HSP10)
VIDRGAQFASDSLTFIPESAKIRPLRDQMIVEPLDVVYSKYIFLEPKTKPLRGIVKAIGPGVYPKQYDYPDKHKRTKMWEGTVFRPCDVKVGDIVQLGGMQLGGYAFEQFWWGDRIHLHCREADVCGIESPDAH